MESAAAAWITIVGRRLRAAQACSSTARSPVPVGMHTIGCLATCREGGGLATGQLVARSNDGDESLADDNERGKVLGRTARAADECEIDATAAQLVDQLVGTGFAHGDLHGGVCLVEARERVEEGRNRTTDHHSHRQAAAQQLARLAHGLAERLRCGQRGACVLEGSFAGGGEPGGAGRAVEQFRAELAFELFDLGAHPGLADVDVLGGSGEVGFLGHRDEVLELAEIHEC